MILIKPENLIPSWCVPRLDRPVKLQSSGARRHVATILWLMFWQPYYTGTHFVRPRWRVTHSNGSVIILHDYKILTDDIFYCCYIPLRLDSRYPVSDTTGNKTE